MAYLPHDFVWNGHFARLQSATKIILHVIATIADYTTGEFYHSVGTIARLAGLSRRSATRAIKELEELTPPIIQTQEKRPGKPTIRIYLPALRDVDNSARGVSPMAQGYDTHVSPTYDTHVSQTLTTEQNKQQQTGFSDKFINKLVNEYGFEEVHARVVVISKMNGRIENPRGLLVHSLKRGYIPVDKELAAKQKMERRRQAEDAHSKRLQEEHEEAKRLRDDADPEVVAAEIAKCMAMLDAIPD